LRRTNKERKRYVITKPLPKIKDLFKVFISKYFHFISPYLKPDLLFSIIHRSCKAKVDKRFNHFIMNVLIDVIEFQK